MSGNDLRCPRCLRALPIEAFGFNRATASGRNSRCMECERERKRLERSTPEGRRANVEAVRRYHQRRATAEAEASASTS